MKRAPDFIFVGHNSISNKWQVRHNSVLQSEHDSLERAEYVAIDMVLAILDKGTACEWAIEKL